MTAFTLPTTSEISNASENAFRSICTGALIIKRCYDIGIMGLACIWFAGVAVYAIGQYFGELYYGGGKDWAIAQFTPTIAAAKAARDWCLSDGVELALLLTLAAIAFTGWVKEVCAIAPSAVMNRANATADWVWIWG